MNTDEENTVDSHSEPECVLQRPLRYPDQIVTVWKTKCRGRSEAISHCMAFKAIR